MCVEGRWGGFSPLTASIQLEIRTSPPPPNQLPHTRTALATKPRRQLPGNQTMPELLAVVLVSVCVCVEDSLCFACVRWKVGKELRKCLSL